MRCISTGMGLTELTYQGHMLPGVTGRCPGRTAAQRGEFHSEAPTVQVTAMLDTGACNTKPAGRHSPVGSTNLSSGHDLIQGWQC